MRGFPSVSAALMAWKGRQKPTSYFSRQQLMMASPIAVCMVAKSRTESFSPIGRVSR